MSVSEAKERDRAERAMQPELAGHLAEHAGNEVDRPDRSGCPPR
jgi:hypothetical protein